MTPDGETALTSSEDGWLRRWDLASGDEWPTHAGLDGAVTAIAASVDGKLAVTGGADRTVRLWDAAKGVEKRCLLGHEATVISVALSPDGRWAASSDDAKRAILWDLETGRAARMFAEDSPVRVGFTEDGFLVGPSSLPTTKGRAGLLVLGARATPDGKVALRCREKLELWDLPRGAVARSFDHSEQAGLPFAISRSGKLGLTAHGRFISVWRLDGGWVTDELDVDDRPSVAVFLSEQAFLVGCTSGRVFRFDR